MYSRQPTCCAACHPPFHSQVEHSLHKTSTRVLRQTYQPHCSSPLWIPPPRPQDRRPPVGGEGGSRTRKHREAGCGRPEDGGVWTAKTVKRPRQQPAQPQYANNWAPLTRKRHTMPHSAQPQHANRWAPRTRKRHQQEHRPQRPTESSDPTQRAKGRTGDCPGPRKGATTRRNVTRGEGECGLFLRLTFAGLRDACLHSLSRHTGPADGKDCLESPIDLMFAALQSPEGQFVNLETKFAWGSKRRSVPAHPPSPSAWGLAWRRRSRRAMAEPLRPARQYDTCGRRGKPHHFPPTHTYSPRVVGSAQNATETR